MSRSKPIALAVLGSLALIGLATPLSAQSPGDLTAHERKERGLDIVRYCAPQIAALGRSWPQGAANHVDALLSLEEPATIAQQFIQDLDQIGSILPLEGGSIPGTGQDHPLWLARICIGGRAIALDAERFDELGLITFKNNSGTDLTFLPGSGFRPCTAQKNGGHCIMWLPAGSHRIKVSFPDGHQFDTGDTLIVTGAPTYSVINDQ